MSTASKVKQFMQSQGYTNNTSNYGIKQNHDVAGTWNYKKPSVMLSEFLNFMNTQPENS
ncbi:hypothetical protein I5168_12060 [Nonlabens sp. SCSIO 43208]|uniref:hypothetical protein n=1 Tax=Nonlabens sp. SCSIO 43208 TaxID=2793009 RepID=UPI003D6A323B